MSPLSVRAKGAGRIPVERGEASGMASTRTRSTTTTTAVADKPKRRASTPRRPATTHDDIALRAYAIFQTEGGGDHVDHWLRAEQELAAPKRRRR